jgi:hypothetical protein
MANDKKPSSTGHKLESTAAAPRTTSGHRSSSGKVTSQDVADQLGIRMTPRLTATQIQRLRRALPGYVSILDDVARQLEEDQHILGVDVTPQELHDTQIEQRGLSEKEAIIEAVYYAIYHQRLQTDDRGMGMLQRIDRRVVYKGQDDPDLLVRWKFLRDFLSSYRPGRKGKGGGNDGGPQGQ